MSLAALQWAQEQAENRTGNILDSALALVAGKNVRWINLLVTNADEKTRNIIAKESFLLMSYLIRKRELSKSTMAEVRVVYPEFDPDKHCGVFRHDENGRIVNFRPAKLEAPLTKDLFFASHVWKTAMRHAEFTAGLINSLEIFADGLWELTGTALIRKMVDYTGRTNYAIDTAMADQIVADLFAPGPKPNDSVDADTIEG